MISVSSPKPTARARPLSFSRMAALGLRSEVLTPGLLHDRTILPYDLENHSNLSRAAIVRFGQRDWRSEPYLGIGVAGPGVDVRRLVAPVAPKVEPKTLLVQNGRHAAILE